MATLIIPTPLRKYTDGEANFVTNATTIEEAVKALTETHPKISNQILDTNGKLRHFIKVFVGEEDIRFLNNEQTEIKEDTIVSLIPAIAGGVA
ncbi:MAG: MoaD/ThiS family protein [Chitinophagales bacterium]|nr:MoaD/ThiS family protein [Chitinophagales bacterium]